MSGYVDDNRPAFRSAAKFLRSIGFVVCSPDELDDIEPLTNATWKDYLQRDIPWAARADCGVALPGWRNSRGATLEASIFRALEKPVMELRDEVLWPLEAEDLPIAMHPETVRA